MPDRAPLWRRVLRRPHVDPVAEELEALRDALTQRTRQRDQWRDLADSRYEVVMAQDREILALRHALADLGKQLPDTRRSPLGDDTLTDTLTMPRTRSAPAPGPQWFEAGELVTPWPPSGTEAGR